MRLPRCAKCKIPSKDKICNAENGRGPTFCPTILFSDLVPKVKAEYKVPEIQEFFRQATIQEAEGYGDRETENYIPYPIKPRLMETIEFAKKMHFKRLGIAFCIGLQKEAGMLTEILEIHGFEVASVCCKAGKIPKEFIGIKEEEKIEIGKFETMCNPILQAEILNQTETELNILLGLCVGHDALFLKKSKAFCTVLAAKDRVTGHNPLSALYTSHSYYQKIKMDQKR
ncbi:MAG: DUF1847 domain-containing protein [Deltaproteobacteria bacterium]|nr:DUF1847 domain-containing protein [Deltaproteobacteria bacterium]